MINQKKVFLFLLSFLICLPVWGQMSEVASKVNILAGEYRYEEALEVVDSLLEESGYWADSIAAADTAAICLAAGTEELVLLKASFLKKLQRFGEAVEFLTEFNRRYAESTGFPDLKVTGELAECHTAVGDFTSAVQTYLLLERMAPGNVYFILQRGLAYYRTEDYPSAIASGKMLLAKDSTNSAALSLVANSFNKRGLADSALFYYDKMLRIKPMDVGTISKKANILLSEKRFGDVAEMTSAFMAKDSTNLIINPIYALSLHLDGQYEKSNEAFFKQRRIGGDSYGTNYYIGLNYFLLNQKFLAEPFLANAYAEDSTDVNLVYYYASSMGWQTYNFKEAKRLFEKALDMMKPDSTMMHKIYAGYALGYYLSGDYHEALKHYKTSVSYNPSFTSALLSMGYCCEKLEDYSGAVRYYREYQKYLKVGTPKYEEVEERIQKVRSEEFMQER